MIPITMNFNIAILFSILMLDVEPSNINKIQHSIGEIFGGGIIFQLDESKMHGLICSLSDIRDASKQELLTTASNASSTISSPERANDLCESYVNSDFGTGSFSDWYLPTIEELKILYQEKNTINESLKKSNPEIVD